MRQLGGGGLLQLTPPPVSTRVTLCGRTAQVWPRLGARRRRHPAVAAAGSQSGSSGFDNSPTVSSSRQAQSANEELVESEAWTAETAVGAARRRLAWAQRLRQQEEAPQQLEGGRWAAGGRAGETVHGEASTSGRGAAEAGDAQWEAAQRLRARQMASASAAAAPLQQAAPAPPQQPSTARYFFAGAAAAVAIHYLVNFLGTLPVVRRIVQRFIWSSEEAAELPPPPWPLPPWPPSQLPPWPPAPLPPWPPAADGAAARGGAASLASTDVAPEGTAVAGVVSAHAGESVEWVNMCWRKAWRVYQRGLERWIQDLLQMLFDMLIDEGMVPQFVQRLRIMEFTLDHEAPYVSNMRRRTSRKDSDLNGVVDVRYCGGARMLLLIEVGTGRWRVKVPVLVSDLDLESSLWLKIRLAPMCPYIGTISLAFVGQPSIRVQLSPYSRLRLMKIPVLQPFLRKLLTVDLPALMTLPKRLEFSIPPAVTAVAEAAVGRDAVMRAVASAVLQADALEHALLAALPLGPQGAAGGVSLPDFFRGELGVTLREARDLPVWGFPWQSNPYCRITLGKQAVVSRRDDDTSHAGRHRAPVWNQEFQFLVEDPMVQSLEVTIRDSPMTGRTDVGRASLPLSSLPPDGLLDVWLPVESSMPGEKVQGAVLLSLSYKSFQDDDADPGSREAAAFAGLPPAAITDVKSAADASSRAAVAASAAAAAVAVTKAAAARAAARMARSGKEQQQQGEGSGGDGGNGSNGAAPPPAGGATPAAAGNGAVVTDPAHLLTAKSSASSSGTGSYGASAASNGNGTEAEAGAYAGSLAKAVNQVLQQEQQKASAAANGSGAARARAATAASAADRARVNQLSAMAATMQQLTAEVDSLLVGGDKEAAEMAVRAVAAAEAAAVTAVVAGDVFGANQALQEAAEALEATVERMASGAAAAAGNPGMRTLQDRFEERFYLAEDLGRGSGAGAGESAEESGGEQRRAAGAGVATAARTAQRRVAQALAAAEAAAALAEPPGGAGGTEADSGAVAESAAAPAAVDEAAGTSSSAAGDAGAPGAEASAQEEEKEEQPQGWLGALASLWSKPQQEQPKQQPKGKGGEDDAAPAGKKARPKPKRPRQKGAKGGADEGGAGVGAGAGAAGAGESQPLRDIVLPDDIPIEEIAAELQNSWKLREQHVEVLIQKAVENRRRQSEQPWLVLLSVMATTTTVLLAIVLYRLQTGGIPHKNMSFKKVAPRPIPTIISSVSPINSRSKDNLYNSSEFDDKSCTEVRRKNSNDTSFAAYNCKSPATTPSSRDNKAGWFEIHQKHAALAISSKSEIILMGDSIIAGLSRYHNVWRKHFNPIRALNFGIGGDRTQHVLWRAENLTLNDAIKYIVIHCGTNNIDRDHPQDIANGIVSIGLVFQEINPNIKIVVTGLLPRDSCHRSYRREKITETNKYLKKLCRDNLRNFYYMKQDIDWTLEGGDLNEELYYSDCLHLVETGNDKLAASIVSILNKIQREEDVTYSSDDLEAESSQNLLKKRRPGKRRRSLSPVTLNHKRLRSYESFHESPSRQSSGNEKIDKLLETPNKWRSVRKLSKVFKSKIHDATLNLKKDHSKFASVAKSIDISSLDDTTRKEARLAKFGTDGSDQNHSNNKMQNSIFKSKVKSTVALAKDGVKNSLVKCIKNNVQLANLALQKQKKKEDLQDENIATGKVKSFSDTSRSDLE